MIVGHWTLIIGHSRRAAARTAHGEGGIRTPDKVLRPYNGLANRRLQPLGHLSNFAGRNLAGVAKPRYPSVIHLTTPPARATARCSRPAAARSATACCREHRAAARAGGVVR